MSYLLYTKPSLFTFVLLAMNACGMSFAHNRSHARLLLTFTISGVLIVSVYINIVHLHSHTYGEPPIRVARSLAGLAIALAIVIAFQLLVLRNPARRTLRKALAESVYDPLDVQLLANILIWT